MKPAASGCSSLTASYPYSCPQRQRIGRCSAAKYRKNLGWLRDWSWSWKVPVHSPIMTPKGLILLNYRLRHLINERNPVFIRLKVGKIACEKTGRSARLMELDPKYCDVIVKRWQDFTGKDATLEKNGKTFKEISSQ